MWLDKMAAVYVLIRSTVVALLCVQTTKAQHVHVVAKLWADGSRIPHGYVVPVGGDVTFTCRHNDSLTRSLFWEIVIVNGTVTTPTTALFLSNEPGLSSPATGNTDNPVNLTVHNLQLGNNGSTVRCSVEVEGSPAFILVEGVPSCPMLNLSSLTAEVSSLSVTWTAVEHTLLPIWYQVMVSASDNYTWSQETTTNHVNISTSRPLASTAYNISVTTCNEAGCNEGCPVYTTNETATEDTGVVIVGNLQAWTIGLISLCAILFALSTIIIAVVAIVKVMMFRAKSFDSGAKERQGTKGQEEIKGTGDTKKEQI